MASLHTHEDGSMVITRADGRTREVPAKTSDSDLAAMIADFIGPPEPVRYQIDKSTITERLITAGKIGPAMDALMADPASFGRWIAAADVYHDDPDVVAFVAAAGADVAAIMAPATDTDA